MDQNKTRRKALRRTTGSKAASITPDGFVPLRGGVNSAQSLRLLRPKMSATPNFLVLTNRVTVATGINDNN